MLGLDALRGLAAIAVLVLHLGAPLHGAHLAVDFFFMLSGFVMARTYEARLASGSMGPLAFMAKRYRRLWGWMALGTSMGFVALILTHGMSYDLWIAFALMAALLPAFNMAATPYLLNLPLWSIVYELVANAAHALGLARLGKRGLALVALACFAGLVWATLTMGFPRAGMVQYHWVTLFKVGASYTMGVLIWRLWGDKPPIKVPLAAALAALPAYCLVVYLWHLPAAPLVFVAVIAPLMMFGGMGARITNPKRAEMASALGDLSFPLYAVHVPAIMLLQAPGGPILCAGIGLATWLWLLRERWRRAPAKVASAANA
ncbi:MAG: acyltransferase [Pseudomonadota bacterium]